jgi:HAD superfamily hydrolase (TIGR01509 family)
MNVLHYLGLEESFDFIMAGVNVSKGKPDPEIYTLTMSRLGVLPDEVLIFEDSQVGLQAAEASGSKYIKITEEFFK